MASSIPRGSNLRNTHHTNINKDKLEPNWPLQVLPGVDCRAEEGSPKETAMLVGDHQPHSELGKEEAKDWKKRKDAASNAGFPSIMEEDKIEEGFALKPAHVKDQKEAEIGSA
jgi:hypothetical protein